MWPWSTIRRLRTESSTYQARWSMLNERYETLDGKYRAALKEVVRAQDETARLRFVQTELDHANGVIADLQVDNRNLRGETEELRSRIIDTGALRHENACLKAQLSDAPKVTRGAGGRFAKALT